MVVFTPDFVLSALRLLVDKMLPLTTTDLENLEDEPEEWSTREASDEEAWAFEFRVGSTVGVADVQPCAERVLIALNNACRHLPATSKVIEPEVLRMLHEAEGVYLVSIPLTPLSCSSDRSDDDTQTRSHLLHSGTLEQSVEH